jgi:peroxin-16
MSRESENLASESFEVCPIEHEQGLWHTYCQIVERYLPLVEFTDEAISRLLFLTPLSSEDEGASRWREVIWGFLQLNRLALDLAVNQRRRPVENSYGTSMDVVRPSIPATSIRIALTILQSLGPVAQELVRSSTSQRITLRRQSRVRVLLERMRFVLRGYLLVNYWWHVRKDNKLFNNNMSESGTGQRSPALRLVPGLLLEGGLFPVHSNAPTTHQERARMQREQYQGRRTGRRVTRGTLASAVSSLPEYSQTFPLIGDTVRVILGELLYIARPLFQAELENSQSGDDDVSSLGKTWILSLLMDLASLWSLQSTRHDGNVATQNELKRRKLRLLLYLLRVPVWDRLTKPRVDNLCASIERIPLFGKLLTNYLYEWLYYWRLYRAEEG